MIRADEAVRPAPILDGTTNASVAVDLIDASSQPWNSATTLYLARALQGIALGRPLSVLDLGCGDGRTISLLHRFGHELHGVDLPDRAEVLRQNLFPLFGDHFESRVRIVTDERRVPFETGQFDVIYANQVFEHVRFLDQMLSECARMLRADGALVALFPTATYPVEGHVLVPFAHWIPSSSFRRAYLCAFLSIGVGRKLPGMSARQSAREWDDRLRQYTFYRFINEIEDLFRYYFEEFSVDTGRYVRAKVDLLSASPSLMRRALGRGARTLQGRFVSALVTHGFCAAFCARRPKLPETRKRVTAWRH